jgi:hypothetical protein
VPLMSKLIDERLAKGPEMVSANFVIPYPPGFPIMVPGQVIAKDTIEFMRKLDVKEIHGYDATRGLKLIKSSAIGRGSNGERATPQREKRKGQGARANGLGAKSQSGNQHKAARGPALRK